MAETSVNISQYTAIDEELVVPILQYMHDEEKAAFVGNIKKIKKASAISSIFNLSCTIVGAGIMSLPAAIKILGVIPGVLLIIMAGLLTEVSVEMLLRFSDRASAPSYAEVMEDSFGAIGKALLQISVIINNVGILIIYMIIIEDVLSGSTSDGVHYSGVLEGWFGEHWWTSRAFVVVVITLGLFIPVRHKRIDSLSFTSAIAVALAIFFIIVVIGITVYKLIDGSIDQPAWFPTITDLSSFLNLFTAVPVLVCAFLCHYNVHAIRNELEQPSKMHSVVKSSLAFCATVYVTIGLFGFLLFGDSTASDLLSNFDTSLGIRYSSVFNDIVRVSYTAHIILVFPVVFYPLRVNFDGLVFPSARPFVEDRLRFRLITLGLITVIVLGALFIPSIWVAFEFTGATAGALILFIFPASIVLKDRYGIAKPKDKVLAVLLIAIAVFSDLVAMYSDASSLF
ncbi:hypothetical protein V2J09_013364 [Rumex salicifolius]